MQRRVPLLIGDPRRPRRDVRPRFRVDRRRGRPDGDCDRQRRRRLLGLRQRRHDPAQPGLERGSADELGLARKQPRTARRHRRHRRRPGWLGQRLDPRHQPSRAGVHALGHLHPRLPARGLRLGRLPQSEPAGRPRRHRRHDLRRPPLPRPRLPVPEERPRPEGLDRRRRWAAEGRLGAALRHRARRVPVPLRRPPDPQRRRLVRPRQPRLARPEGDRRQPDRRLRRRLRRPLRLREDQRPGPPLRLRRQRVPDARRQRRSARQAQRRQRLRRLRAVQRPLGQPLPRRHRQPADPALEPLRLHVLGRHRERRRRGLGAGEHRPAADPGDPVPGQPAHLLGRVLVGQPDRLRVPLAPQRGQHHQRDQPDLHGDRGRRRPVAHLRRHREQLRRLRLGDLGGGDAGRPGGARQHQPPADLGQRGGRADR